MVLAIAVMAAAVGKPSTNLGDRRRISPHLHYRNTRCVKRALPFLQRGDLPLVLRHQAAPDGEERLGLGKIVPHALDRAGQQALEADGVSIDDHAEVSHGGFLQISLVVLPSCRSDASSRPARNREAVASLSCWLPAAFVCIRRSYP